MNASTETSVTELPADDFAMVMTMAFAIGNPQSSDLDGQDDTDYAILKLRNICATLNVAIESVWAVVDGDRRAAEVQAAKNRAGVKGA
jgi:hypothetical protein